MSIFLVKLIIFNFLVRGATNGITGSFLYEKVSFLADITGEKNDTYILNGGTKIFIDNDVAMRIYLIDITKSRSAKETLYTFGLSLSKYI